MATDWEKDVVIMTDNNERVYESGEYCFQGEKYIKGIQEQQDQIEMLKNQVKDLKDAITR